ncbi:unnamed protein product [Clonostachys rosea f. rosea IK726]|uniref:Protein phosphatase n=3 Tax=Bionectria ochroleuca TaxID=29856 RepID=A0A0B7JW62_BIOOC|nr:unnamed protein product [Clonostachys rosea f. rosea IK726]
MVRMRPSHRHLTILRSLSRAQLSCNGRLWRGCSFDRQFASSQVSAESSEDHKPSLPFRFDTGVALFAKRTPRPFPPPFLSPPSASFSDALSTHHRSRDRVNINGELLRGQTNGDDAVFASDYFLCANDGVGAWATRPRGHAGLWSRLILHFWASEIDQDLMQPDAEPNPVATLQTAYERTLEATKLHNWQGTTTVCGAQLHYTVRDTASRHRETIPLLYVTNLGDCQVMVLRPREQEILYKTKEQWHWFDCPRQLGTNSPDTPETNAVVDTVDIEVGDVVLAMTDGVIDNLWEHEIVDIIFSSIRQLGPENSESAPETQPGEDARDIMKTAAQNLVAAAKRVAMDPYAESPFMEHAIEEGLASVGGKLDDISVVAALCVKNE